MQVFLTCKQYHDVTLYFVQQCLVGVLRGPRVCQQARGLLIVMISNTSQSLEGVTVAANWKLHVSELLWCNGVPGNLPILI